MFRHAGIETRIEVFSVRVGTLWSSPPPGGFFWRNKMGESRFDNFTGRAWLVKAPLVRCLDPVGVAG